MKVEYDSVRDLLYIWFKTPEAKAARTEVVSPGVHADFDRDGKLIGIEVLDASDVAGEKMQFEVDLSDGTAEASAA
jgi:uncharacterized protein YuzE